MGEDPNSVKIQVQPLESTKNQEDMNLKTEPGGSAVKTTFLEFASTTTAHGISRFANTPVWKAKVSWFLIWLGVMVGFIFMVVQLVTLYQSKPVKTSFSVKYEKVLTFPGVTICNLNIIHLSKSQDIFTNSSASLQKRSQKTDLHKSNFAKKEISGLEADSIVADEVAATIEDILEDVNGIPESQRIEKGYQFESFIVNCRWSGVRCDKGKIKDLYWVQNWHWKYGNCYTFNGFTSVNGTKVEPFNASGALDVLSLTIDIKISEYLPTLTTEEGIRVLIEDQDHILLPDEKGFSIQPGSSASIAIQKQSIITTDVYNNGSCKDVVRTDNIKYSLQSCKKYCRHNKEMEKCNCTSVEYIGFPKGRLCDTIDEEECILEVKNNFTNNLYHCDHICPVSCSNVVFHHTITQGRLHSNGYSSVHGIKNQVQSNVNASKKEILAECLGAWDIKSKNIELHHYSENIIQLSVYYGSQAVETIETTVYYEFKNLISDVGGQLGLWIGVSAVTCMELLALMWNILVVLLYRKKDSRVGSGQV